VIRQSKRRHWVILALLPVLLVIAIVMAPRAAHWARHYRAAWRRRSTRWVRLQEHGPKPVPTAEDKRHGFMVFRRSILERVYPSSRPRADERVSSVSLHATLGEYEPVQLAVYALRDLHAMEIEVSDLADAGGHSIPHAEVSVRMVRYYGAPLSIRVANRFGVVPKTLEIAVPLDVRKATARPYWITVHVPEDVPGGQYEGTVTFRHSAAERSVRLLVDVVPTRLREPDILYGALSTNILANVGTPRRAAADLQRADLMFQDQREHGMNSISIRSSRVYQERDGHPYLPDLDAAMDFYKRYGFTQPLVYCPGQLFKTNKIDRSSNYHEYDPAQAVPLAQLIAAYYTRAFRDAGLPGLVFMPVEEPNLKSGIDPADPPDIRQRMARELTRAIKASGGLTAMTCTPESVRSAIDSLDYWIVAFKRFTPALYGMAEHAHAHLCLYANATMMGQGTYFPRFLFGYFVWANGLKGMLPWTYPMQPKRFPQNIGRRGEGGLNVRDGFIGIDGKPIPTIQWELSREGIDDVKYLVTIEALAAQARASGDAGQRAAAGDAEHFLAALRADVDPDARHYLFEDERTFEPVPVDDWDARKFEATREQAVEILKRLLETRPLPAGRERQACRSASNSGG
jgi:hypothetical protein